MRMLFVSNLYPPEVIGGYEILCSQVANELARRGHDVTVLTTEGANDGRVRRERVIRRLSLVTPFGDRADHSRGTRLLTSRINQKITREVLDEVRPDIVFVWSQLRLTLGSARAAEEAGYPVLYTLNDEHLAGYAAVPASPNPRRMAGWIADRTLLREITLDGLRLENVVTISRSVRDGLVAAGVPVSHARVLYQGIPIERFPLKRVPGSLAVPARVLYVGQLHRYKGVHTILEALEMLGAPHGVELTIVGGGDWDYEQELRGFAREKSLPVRFEGRVPHDKLSRIYCDHDMFVFPSIWKEPFGLTHLEAMASGLPVISTANGGHGEVLRDGVNSLIFDPEDAEALACRIATLAGDDSMRRRLALAGRRMVERDFTLSAYVSGLETMLEECARHGVAA